MPVETNRKSPGVETFLFIDPSGGTTYAKIICLTSNSFGIVNNIIDAKSKCGADQLPGTQSFNVDFEGQLIYNATGATVGIYDLLVLAKNQTTIGWKIAQVTPESYDVIITGTGFVAEVANVYGDEAPATFTGKLGIYGTPTITENPS